MTYVRKSKNLILKLIIMFLNDLKIFYFFSYVIFPHISSEYLAFSFIIYLMQSGYHFLNIA